VELVLALHARMAAGLRCGEVSPGPPYSSAVAAAPNICGRDWSLLAAKTTQVANFTLQIISLHENLCIELFLSATFPGVRCDV